MFRTLIYPSSGACDCVVDLPHRSSFSQFVVCWRFGKAGFGWCSFCRLKHKLYKYCTNCTVGNWTVLTVITQKLPLLVELYNSTSVQLNCTYRNYTEAAATCSAVQQHSTFTVQILYKLYSLELNCTYGNYTEAAATCSPAQHQRNCQGDVFWRGMQSFVS